MEALGIVVLVLIGWWWMRERAAANVRLQYAIRFPEIARYDPDDTFQGRTFVDFERMQMVVERSDYDYHHTRVLQLRRKDGATWEVCEQRDSLKRTARHHEAEGEPMLESQVEERALVAELLAKPDQWAPCPSEALEPAYQVYLHKNDPGITFGQSPVDRAVASDRLPRRGR